MEDDYSIAITKGILRGGGGLSRPPGDSHLHQSLRSTGLEQDAQGVVCTSASLWTVNCFLQLDKCAYYGLFSIPVLIAVLNSEASYMPSPSFSNKPNKNVSTGFLLEWLKPLFFYLMLSHCLFLFTLNIIVCTCWITYIQVLILKVSFHYDFPHYWTFPK